MCTMLLGWLKPYTRSLSPLLSKRVVLGVIGTRSSTSDMDDFMAPIMEAWCPDEIVMAAEGESSFAIRQWAETRKIPVRCLGCDWRNHGKRASCIRDAQIQREATHLLLLQGPRSNALSTLAARLHKRGRPVAISERPGLPATSEKPAH